MYESESVGVVYLLHENLTITYYLTIIKSANVWLIFWLKPK